MGKVMDGIKKLVELANGTEEAKNLIAEWGKSVAQLTVEGEGDCYIKIKGGEASFHEGNHESPDFTLKCQGEVFMKILSGELDAYVAYLDNQINLEGPISEAVKLIDIITAVAKAINFQLGERLF